MHQFCSSKYAKYLPYLSLGFLAELCSITKIVFVYIDKYTYACHCRHAGQRVIHDYYYKPNPIFYGDGNRYFGVELEIDDAGENNTNAAKIADIANCEEEHIYCKHDGSLNEGFEIVTHPMTLDYHLNHVPWAAVLAKAKELGYRSHQSGTCGLHVHVPCDIGDKRKIFFLC